MILGNMFSGKSVSMMRAVRRLMAAQQKCVIINYAKDTRYSETGNVTTHDGQSMETHFRCNMLSEIKLDELDEVDAVVIDEAHFFQDLVEFAVSVANMGKICIVSGLDGDFMQHPWKNISELEPKADKVVHLDAVCMVCHREGARFSKRISAEIGVEVIGGSDKYIAVCRDCLHMDTTNTEIKKPVTYKSPKQQSNVTVAHSMSPVPLVTSSSAPARLLVTDDVVISTSTTDAVRSIAARTTTITSQPTATVIAATTTGADFRKIADESDRRRNVAASSKAKELSVILRKKCEDAAQAGKRSLFVPCLFPGSEIPIIYAEAAHQLDVSATGHFKHCSVHDDYRCNPDCLRGPADGIVLLW